MGAWGSGIWEKDTAADFAGDLDDAEAGERASRVQEALDALSSPSHLDADVVCTGLAAAALVADAVAPGTAGALEGATAYGPEVPLPPAELVPLRASAAAALRRALDPHENAWADLWQEVDGLDGATAEPLLCLAALDGPQG